MKIPRDPSWCSRCIEKGVHGPCDDHRGTDGKPAEYVGSNAYQPTKWVLEVVGQRYASCRGLCLCTGYDPRHGFWMQCLATGERFNISEGAIGRSFGRIQFTAGARRLLQLISELGRMPTTTEAGLIAVEPATETLRDLSYIGASDALTDAGQAALGRLKAEGPR